MTKLGAQSAPGSPHECQSRVEVDPDALAAEITGRSLDVSPQEVAGRRMHDRVDRLGEIDDHRALVPPEDVEGGEVPMDELGVEDQPNLALQLSPDPSRSSDVEVDFREPRRGTIAVADERHAVAVFDPLDGWRHGDAGIVQPLEGRPFVRLPPCLEVLLAETRSLLHRAVLMTGPFTPDAGVEIVVAKTTLEPRLEPLLRHEARAGRTGSGDEVDLALLASLEHAEIEIFVGCVGKPVAGEQCGHASSVSETRRWVRSSRARR